MAKMTPLMKTIGIVLLLLLPAPIFIVFGAVLMASGAGDLLMKIANRLTGAFTGGAAHAAVASSALLGTPSGAATFGSGGSPATFASAPLPSA